VSLLQDALRRAQKTAGSRPPSPSPFPDPAPGKPVRRRRLPATLAAAAVVLGAATVFLLARHPFGPRIVGPAARVGQAPSPAAAATPAAAAAGSPVAPAPAAIASPRVGGAAEPPARAAAPARPAASAPRVAPAAGTAQGDPPREAAGRDPLVEKFNAAVAALDRGDDAEAARLFRETAAASPDLVEAWNGLGLSLLRGKDERGADEAFARTLDLAPRYVPGLLNAGLLRLSQGRAEEAAGLFSRIARKAGVTITRSPTQLGQCTKILAGLPCIIA